MLLVPPQPATVVVVSGGPAAECCVTTVRRPRLFAWKNPLVFIETVLLYPGAFWKVWSTVSYQVHGLQQLLLACGTTSVTTSTELRYLALRHTYGMNCPLRPQKQTYIVVEALQTEEMMTTR